jgi:hypothetical protein
VLPLLYPSRFPPRSVPRSRDGKGQAVSPDSCFSAEQSRASTAAVLLKLSSGGSSSRRVVRCWFRIMERKSAGAPPAYFAPGDSYPRRGPDPAPPSVQVVRDQPPSVDRRSGELILRARGANRPMICSRALARLSGSLSPVYQLVPDCAQPKERPGLLVDGSADDLGAAITL